MSGNSSRYNDDGRGWTVIGSVLSIGGGSLLYSAYRDYTRRTYVQQTPWTNAADLEKLRHGDKPLYVKVQGSVGTDFPITSEISKEQGAIYEKKIEGVWYSWRIRESAADRFQKDFLRRVSPFYLQVQDQSVKKEIRLNVTPFSLHDPDLAEVHKHEEKTGNFFASLVLGWFYIPYPYKVIVTESILPLRRELFAVGDAVRTRDGRLQLVAPSTGILAPKPPGVLSLKQEHEWAADLERRQGVKQVFGGLLSALGALCFVAASRAN